MSARFAITSTVIVLLSACSVEDENPTERCSAELACSDELVCYRGFCVDRGEATATADDAGDLTTPSPVTEPRDAAASAVGARDASVGSSASESADAARAASVEQSSVEQSSEPSSPSSEGAAQDAASERPSSMPSPADAGVTPAATPAPVTQPSPEPLIPEATVPSAGTPSTWLTDLVQLGFLPVQVLNCVPKCLTLEPAKECDQCLEKALQGEGKKVECDNNGRARGNRASCVVRECDDDDECEK